MMMVILVQWYSRIEIPGIQSRIGIKFLSFEQRTIESKESDETKVEQRMNEKVEQ
jgi:hypothetical protein